MSRSALIVSLALHAGLMGLIARWSLATHRRSGTPGVVFSIAPGGAAETLLVEAAPAATPESGPSLAEPEFIPPLPAVSAVTDTAFRLPADITIAHERTAMPPAAAGRADNRSVVRSGKSAAGRRASSGGAADGERSGAGSSSGSGGYVPPQFRIRYKPPYPAAARTQRMEGTVLLLVSVDSAGRVTHADVQRTCGHALLDRAALDAVRSWRFEPARQDGVATSAKVEVPVRFRFG